MMSAHLPLSTRTNSANCSGADEKERRIPIRNARTSSTLDFRWTRDGHKIHSYRLNAVSAQLASGPLERAHG